ncbi:hypothetical protein FOA52_011803 [Chlamydomonas sp. UWO 241]|nr:hypothetical protein FOA52_011803 [Chlamydomonas sp. UWO 241]
MVATDAPVAVEFPRGARFTSGPSDRFAFDARSPVNFLSPQHAGATDNSYDGAFLPLAETAARRPDGRSSMASTRPRTADALSNLSHDARHDALHPASEATGPGCYEFESHDTLSVGTLAPESPLRLGMPARDPTRVSQAFDSPKRGRLFPLSEAHHLSSYVSPDTLGITASISGQDGGPLDWSRLGEAGGRVDASEWRFGGRPSALRDELPANLYDLPRDNAGRLIDMASDARAACATIPFSSTQPRVAAVLPPARVNNAALGRARLDDPAACARGPGAYSAPTSIGGAKRETYRMFVMPDDARACRPVTKGAGAGGGGGGQRQRMSASVAMAQQVGGGLGGVPARESMAFGAGSRAQKFGAYSVLMDSSYLRKR